MYALLHHIKTIAVSRDRALLEKRIEELVAKSQPLKAQLDEYDSGCRYYVDVIKRTLRAFCERNPTAVIRTATGACRTVSEAQLFEESVNNVVNNHWMYFIEATGDRWKTYIDASKVRADEKVPVFAPYRKKPEGTIYERQDLSIGEVEEIT